MVVGKVYVEMVEVVEIVVIVIIVVVMDDIELKMG